MPKYSWARLWYDLLGSTDYMKLSEVDRWRWDMIIVIVRCKGENGILNWDDEKIADTLRVTPSEWQRTKELFASRRCHYIEPLKDGIKIVNFEKWQPSYDSSTGRVAKYRERRKEEEDCPKEIRK